MQLVIELKKLHQDELIPAPAPEISNTELRRWLIMLQRYCRQLELNREQIELTVCATPVGQLHSDENKSTSQQPASDAETLSEVTITGNEIKVALRDEIYRLNTLHEKALEKLSKLPKTKEHAVNIVSFELVPAWHKHLEKGAEIKTADKKCQSLENTWEAANKDWFYQEPNKNPTWIDMARDLIRSAAEKAWQSEGTSLKEWRGRIDRAKNKHEEERQQLKEETRSKASQIHRLADDLVAQRKALTNELNRSAALVQQIRKVYKGFPKSDEAFSISADFDASSLIFDIKLLKQIEDRKDQEREVKTARGKGQGITGGSSR